jgi:hypothetical protein
MRTAEGWYKLAEGWRQHLNDIATEELTTFEANLLEDLNKHVPDMEETHPTAQRAKSYQLSREEIQSLNNWAEESYKQGGCSAYGPKFDAAMDVARAVNEKMWTPCCPTCCGVVAFEASSLPGWVHIERCRDCGRFSDGESAAVSFTAFKNVYHLCAECDQDQRSPLSKINARAHKHDLMSVVVREEVADRAVKEGMLRLLRTDEDTEQGEK